MNKVGQRVLIACDSAVSLMDFRGKLIEVLAKKHKVHVFTPQIKNPEFRKKLIVAGVAIHENKLNCSNISLYSDLNYIIQLYKLIKTVQPDVFFPYTFKPVIYGTILARLCHISKVTPMLTGLGYNFNQNNKRNFLSIITRSLLKFSLIDSAGLKIIFQNKDDYHTLLKYKILTAKHSIAIVNGSGVDLEHYKYSLPDPDKISFLMMARLINAKGINEYFEAAKIIRSEFPEVEFVLIGTYDKNVDTISPQLYNKINSGTTIKYLGAANDVRPYIKKASIVVLPSYYGEGIPRCLLESMATGRGIITTDSVGCRETVDSVDGVNGLLIPVKNIQALVSSIRYFLSDKGSIKSFGENGLAFAKKKFDVNLVNAEMINIMQLD